MRKLRVSTEKESNVLHDYGYSPHSPHGKPLNAIVGSGLSTKKSPNKLAEHHKHGHPGPWGGTHIDRSKQEEHAKLRAEHAAEKVKKRQEKRLKDNAEGRPWGGAPRGTTINGSMNSSENFGFNRILLSGSPRLNRIQPTRYKSTASRKKFNSILKEDGALQVLHAEQQLEELLQKYESGFTKSHGWGISDAHVTTHEWGKAHHLSEGDSHLLSVVATAAGKAAASAVRKHNGASLSAAQAAATAAAKAVVPKYKGDNLPAAVIGENAAAAALSAINIKSDKGMNNKHLVQAILELASQAAARVSLAARGTPKEASTAAAIAAAYIVTKWRLHLTAGALESVARISHHIASEANIVDSDEISEIVSNSVIKLTSLVAKHAGEIAGIQADKSGASFSEVIRLIALHSARAVVFCGGSVDLACKVSIEAAFGAGGSPHDVIPSVAAACVDISVLKGETEQDAVITAANVVHSAWALTSSHLHGKESSVTSSEDSVYSKESSPVSRKYSVYREESSPVSSKDSVYSKESSPVSSETNSNISWIEDHNVSLQPQRRIPKRLYVPKAKKSPQVKSETNNNISWIEDHNVSLQPHRQMPPMEYVSQAVQLPQVKSETNNDISLLKDHNVSVQLDREMPPTEDHNVLLHPHGRMPPAPPPPI